MKNATILLPLILLLGACTGITARNNALLPVLAKQWQVVVGVQVEAGIAAGETDGTLTPGQATELRTAAASMQSGLESGERFNVAVINWSALRQVALAGVQARVNTGSISAGVGLSLIESINKFDEGYSVLTLR